MRWLLLSLNLALVTTFMGCGQAAPQAPPPRVPQVSVVQPIREPIVVWDRYTGRLQAVESVDVRARVSGYLKAVYFSEGMDVQAGDLLMLIDPRPFDAALRSAESQQSKARADVAVARSKEKQATAELKQVLARQKLARQRLDRMRRLHRTKAVTQDELEDAQSQYDQSLANVEAARANVSSAAAAIKTAEAAVAVAKAAVEDAELQLGYTRIVAPISGRISNWRVTPGNLVQGGSTGADLLTTIVALDPIHCYFDASEDEVLRYKRTIASSDRQGTSESGYRNPVYMKLADETGYPHRGHLDFVDNRLSSNTGTLRARAIFPNADRFLVPGMFAEIRLPAGLPRETVLIPDRAVGNDQSQTFVYIVNGEGKIERREVKLGTLRHGLRIVEDGLTGDEKLVVSGLQTIRPGVPVQATVTELKLERNGDLPDRFEQIPREQWLTVKPAPVPGPATAPRPGG